mmetsp:Transcript_62843/g.172603  ORF Transcript_62843/g.172603 Transcript_62843/m.172603 type:complete len:217 (+) Transcript_62843:1245-1895(+)
MLGAHRGSRSLSGQERHRHRREGLRLGLHLPAARLRHGLSHEDRLRAAQPVRAPQDARGPAQAQQGLPAALDQGRGERRARRHRHGRAVRGLRDARPPPRLRRDRGQGVRPGGHLLRDGRRDIQPQVLRRDAQPALQAHHDRRAARKGPRGRHRVGRRLHPLGPQAPRRLFPAALRLGPARRALRLGLCARRARRQHPRRRHAAFGGGQGIAQLDP